MQNYTRVHRQSAYILNFNSKKYQKYITIVIKGVYYIQVKDSIMVEYRDIRSILAESKATPPDLK